VDKITLQRWQYLKSLSLLRYFLVPMRKTAYKSCVCVFWCCYLSPWWAPARLDRVDTHTRPPTDTAPLMSPITPGATERHKREQSGLKTHKQTCENQTRTNCCMNRRITKQVKYRTSKV